ncbi:DUF721 domain-containing protein [Flammeovirga pacifica]|uniref:RNA-binding protein n=1 Tax=Flammeovirga pacifica TaxID=915059 RepID=A0A1S1Z1B7_FLAPC|nr:DUF721 domain-containing protein [Flammeovirga pacifica]OHX67027.1 hypothetical protein NH26_12065 [Flammeovirga pacifica]
MAEDKKTVYRFRKRTPIPKKHETIGIGDAMQKFVKSLNKGKSYNEAMLNKVWNEVMGHTITSRTQELRLRGKTLYIKLNTPALRNELNMAREHVVKRLNQRLGAEILSEVKFV